MPTLHNSYALFYRFGLIFIAFHLMTGIAAQVVINEICPSNSEVIEDEFGDSSDWIELYNAGEEAVNLNNYFISDDLSNPEKWQFPEKVLAPGEWLLIFASDRDLEEVYLHTNFKLSAGGESVVLSDPDGLIIDQFTYTELDTDRSVGRLQDGNIDWAVFHAPTPGFANAESEGSGFTAAPAWTTEGHFFSGSQQVTLSHPDASVQLYFTRDGSLPTPADELYSGNIQLDTTTAIRVVAIAPDQLPSPVLSRTFFIDDRHDIPVIALMGDPEALWSWENGILVDGGPHAEVEWPYYGSNYWAETEVPIHAEFFTEAQELGIALQADTKVHGGRGARTNPMKPLRVLIKKKYGSNTVEYPFFPDRERTTYKRLVLRNASGDYNNAHFRDAFLARYFIKSGLNLDVLAHRPHAIYINGSYYGLANLREKSDQYYLQHTYGIPTDEIDLLEEDTAVVVGDFEAFNSMYQFIIDHDLSKEEDWQQAQSFFDVENIAEGFIVQSVLNNADWLHNNIKYWRERKEEARWRYIIFDLDIAMGRHDWSHYEQNNLGSLLTPLAGTNRHVNIFLALLENENFRNYFINRYADLLNTIFLPETFTAELDQTVNEIDSEMPKHFARWGEPGYETWKNDRIPVLYEYIQNRPTYARDHIREYFSLTHEVRLRLNTYPEGAGYIQISTIQPEELPWEGIYFNGVPVELRIVPNPGYTFQHWQSTQTIKVPNTSPTIRYNFAEDDEITAFFAEAEPDLQLAAYRSGENKLEVTAGLPNSGTLKLDLYDMQGHLLTAYPPETFPGGQQFLSLPLPQLIAGEYVLQAHFGEEVKAVPFVVF